MSLSDQLILQFYYFMQGPWSKVVFGIFFVVLIIWGGGATRKHAYNYAMKGARFGATSAILVVIILFGAFGYLMVDRRMLAEIVTGKRPISEISTLLQSTANRFRFVLGASTSEGSQMAASEVAKQIEKLPETERKQLQLQMCRVVLQDLND